MISALTSAALRGLAICCCLLGLGASVAAASEPQWRAWAQEAQTRHTLAGRVFDTAQGKLLDPAEGPRRLALPDGIVLLGEVHDNPTHHQVRAWLIADAVKVRPQWRPAVVFEQIDTDRQEAVDRFEQARCRRADRGDPVRPAQMAG